MVELAVTAVQRARTPVLLCALVGLGGLFAGVTGPLLSNFIPLIVRDAIGEHRTAIGGVMAIDNVLLLLLVPWAGAASDRAIARGRGRLPIVLGAFVLAAAGMALFPAAPAFGLGGVIGAMVVLYTGINVQRSPFHALMTDLVPSRYRSLANASVMFQMCVGAIVFLMLGKILGMRTAFLVAAGTVLAIVAVFAVALPRPAASESQAARGNVSLAVRCRVVGDSGRRSRACARSSSRRSCSSSRSRRSRPGSRCTARSASGSGPRRSPPASSPGRWGAWSARCPRASSACASDGGTRCCSASR